MSDIRLTNVGIGDTLVNDSKLYTFAGWDEDEDSGSSIAILKEQQTGKVRELSAREFLSGKFQKV
jgi:hypothetical protein